MRHILIVDESRAAAERMAAVAAESGFTCATARSLREAHGQIALQKPDIKELLSKQAMEPVGSSPQQFAAFLKKDIATWKEVAAAANVSVE